MSNVQLSKGIMTATTLISSFPWLFSKFEDFLLFPFTVFLLVSVLFLFSFLLPHITSVTEYKIVGIYPTE